MQNLLRAELQKEKDSSQFYSNLVKNKIKESDQLNEQMVFLVKTCNELKPQIETFETARIASNQDKKESFQVQLPIPVSIKEAENLKRQIETLNQALSEARK
jgi:hypothetical protein